MKIFRIVSSIKIKEIPEISISTACFFRSERSDDICYVGSIDELVDIYFQQQLHHLYHGHLAKDSKTVFRHRTFNSRKVMETVYCSILSALVSIYIESHTVLSFYVKKTFRLAGKLNYQILEIFLSFFLSKKKKV